MPDWRARVELVCGDIVEQDVDAIVNAANVSLLGGGGVDGAIHRAAGPGLLRACKAIPPDGNGHRCPTGEARITEAGDLPARRVIHGVGPIYDRADPSRSAALLASVHRHALALAVEHGCHSVAFPAISTGAFGYPVADAARVALSTVRDVLDAEPALERVRFVLWSPADLERFQAALEDL